MATHPHPSQRRVAARIYSPSGWLVGTLHVPQAQPLLRYFNGPEEFFTLTDVTLPGHSKPISFLALQRSAALLVIPEEEVSPPQHAPVAHQVSCLLEGGVAMGILRLAESVRVSDHLMQRPRFFVLHDCTVGLDVARGPAKVEATPVALINSGRLVGVSEVDAAPMTASAAS